ncbi:hypothetical protein P875_00064605 [Aspergillus parasiticus SU-1]|uniref:Uncharacterized protein n=1 Tax=Aspergillus parasiticus (strain ATCC 56775 / NRRL 5862 / SRRC 143 / SU-1) TaxID=1403190 RepID=A0A0F0I894_ASPPU|nr:hypothetical protein P875_00064605 [Aspergillus parasiticus SU-1]
MLPQSSKPSEAAGPVLRLRPVPQTEADEVEPEPWQGAVHHDGPMVPHPSFLIENPPKARPSYAIDITKGEYRAQREDEMAKLYQQVRAQRERGEACSLEITAVEVYWPPVDMTQRNGKTDKDLESALESYLIPGELIPVSMRERVGPDWGLNARGIYYRHYFSSAYVTSGHNLWLPSLHDTHWSDRSEDGRRARAERFLKHTLDNERFKKSEYAWEADAWQDVFGLLREDPVLAVDKHEYNTIKQKRHEVSCLLDGQPKFVRRIPDATFGLATFKPADYPDYPDSLDVWSLDRDRLESLLLHRHCGLISDPHWGDVDLVFPFAVYEAKGWSGDPREARRQACSAGAVYLDMLDNLAKKPGPAGGKGRPYQTAQSCNSQVFALTSFGAHWHILVGYKRQRLEREHAGHEGLSESVYVFQRVWSGRVATKRKAWELLSLVDQIHSWGVTEHRDFVIQHLKAWHNFGRMCYANDSKFLGEQWRADPLKERCEEYGEAMLPLPVASLQLAGWVKNLTADAQDKLRHKAVFHFWEAYRRDAAANKDNEPMQWRCIHEGCGPAESPGYPLTTRLGQAFKELEDLDKWPNESKLQKMKRRSCGGEIPPAKRYRNIGSSTQAGFDIPKGKGEVIDLTDD